MEKKDYNSLEWIHRAREENYKKTKKLSPAELIEKSRNATEAVVRTMGLKVIQSREHIHTR